MRWIEIGVILLVGILASVEDIKYQKISNKTIAICLLVGILITVAKGNYLEALYGFLAGSIIIYTVVLICNGGICG